MQEHIPPWLQDAFSFLTVKESKGEQTNPIIKAFYAKVGHATIADDETPWCAALAVIKFIKLKPAMRRINKPTMAKTSK